MKSSIGRQFPLLGLLCCVTCLAFFHLLDRAVFSTTHFSPIFRFLLTVYDMQTAWAAVAVAALALLWKRPAPLQQLTSWLGARPIAVSVASVLPFALAARFVYHAYPLCMDEYAAVFQAKIFSTGKLYAQVPPGLLDWLVVPGFNGMFLIASPETGRVIEGYWPGFSLLLTPFQWLGVPWLCNPVISAAALWLMFRITVEITGQRAAGGWAMLFAAASGAFFVGAISFYSMQAHLAANLLFVWLLLSPTPRRSFAAGAVGSVALIMHNPFPHALFALPWIVWLLFDRGQRRLLLPMILGYLPVTLLAGAGWLLLRTSILDTPHMGASAYALVRGAFGWPTLDMLNMRIAALAKLWVWAAPCLLLFAAVGARHCWADRRIRMLSASALLTFGAYLFVHMDQGHGWGYRYFHSAWGVLPVLGACALARREAGEPSWMPFAGAVAVLNLLLVVPLQLYQIDTFISRHLDALPAPIRPGNNVYFVDVHGGFYSADMVQFDPLLRDADLFLVRRGPALDAALMQANWPRARRVGRGNWGEQWYLGPVDQRALASPGGAPFLQMRPPGLAAAQGGGLAR